MTQVANTRRQRARQAIIRHFPTKINIAQDWNFKLKKKMENN